MIAAQQVAALAIETWKLQATLQRLAGDLPPERAGRVEAQLRFSRSQLDRLLADGGFRLVTFDNEEFTAELPVSALNAEDVGGGAAVFVDQTLEPSIIADGTVVHVGKVILRGA